MLNDICSGKSHAPVILLHDIARRWDNKAVCTATTEASRCHSNEASTDDQLSWNRLLQEDAAQLGLQTVSWGSREEPETVSAFFYYFLLFTGEGGSSREMRFYQEILMIYLYCIQNLLCNH